MASVTVGVGKTHAHVQFDVVEGCGQPIIGTPSLEKLRIVLDPEAAQIIHKPTQNVVRRTWKTPPERKLVVARKFESDSRVASRESHSHACHIRRYTKMEIVEREQDHPNIMGKGVGSPKQTRGP